MIFRKCGVGGVWNFSENSSVLVASPVPYCPGTICHNRQAFDSNSQQIIPALICDLSMEKLMMSVALMKTDSDLSCMWCLQADLCSWRSPVDPFCTTSLHPLIVLLNLFFLLLVMLPLILRLLICFSVSSSYSLLLFPPKRLSQVFVSPRQCLDHWRHFEGGCQALVNLLLPPYHLILQ